MDALNAAGTTSSPWVQRVEHLVLNINGLMLAVRMLNTAKGWREQERSLAEDVALMHSEVSEVLEEWRTFHDVRPHKDAHSGKPLGVPSELADVLIRVLDTADRFNIDLAEAVIQKYTYGWTRPYRHGGKTI